MLIFENKSAMDLWADGAPAVVFGTCDERGKQWQGKLIWWCEWCRLADEIALKSTLGKRFCHTADRNPISAKISTSALNMTFIIVLPILGYLLYRLVLYPRFFSPLRHIPGPPLGYPITGQFGAILRGEAGIPQREWVKQYGPVVRVVGPVGVERLIFMNPEAIHKILVGDWVEYPRVCFFSYFVA